LADYTNTEGLQDRQAFFFQSTAAHLAADSASVIATEASKIRMLVLSQKPANAGQESSMGASTFMCQTFEPTDIEELTGGSDDTAGNGDDGDDLGDTPSEEPGNGNAGNRLSSTGVVGVALVLGLFAGIL
jgi:hypothetical protein